MAYGYSQRFIKDNKLADEFHPGVQLGRICIEKDIPVQDVADHLGVSRQAVYMWFLGRSMPQPRHVDALWRLVHKLLKSDKSPK